MLWKENPMPHLSHVSQWQLTTKLPRLEHQNPISCQYNSFQ